MHVLNRAFSLKKASVQAVDEPNSSVVVTQ